MMRESGTASLGKTPRDARCMPCEKALPNRI
jgi:hypothetical protein